MAGPRTCGEAACRRGSWAGAGSDRGRAWLRSAGPGSPGAVSSRVADPTCAVTASPGCWVSRRDGVRVIQVRGDGGRGEK